MSELIHFAEVEALLREAIEASDGWTENDYGIGIRHCCGTDVDTKPHEWNCWLVKAKKLLNIDAET